MLRALGKPPGDLTRAALAVSWQAEDALHQGTIRFAAQPCFFGGVRYWFLCPACGRRVYALYVTVGLSCWRCAGLRYVSWDWRGHARLSRHYEALATALRHRPGPKPARFTRYVVYAECCRSPKNVNFWTSSRPGCEEATAGLTVSRAAPSALPPPRAACSSPRQA